MRWILRGLAPLIAAVLSACSPAGLLNATVPSGGVQVSADLPYADGPRHTLDVYRPSGVAEPLPIVVFLHGGNWRTGDKDMYPFVARPLARRGAVVAVPDYRLYPDAGNIRVILQDSARAVAWVLAHAAELGGDPRRVFVMGHSAGAYNAAMLAVDPTWLAAAGADRGRLAGFIGLAGPYDFLPLVDQDVIEVFGARDDRSTQPITFADGRAPPMLLRAGTDDTTVRPQNTTNLAEKVRAAGGSVDARLYPGLGHIGIITAFAPVFQHRAPVLDDVAAFVGATAGASQAPRAAAATR